MRRRLSYANVMATLAFFFALTGGAMAVGKYIVSTDPITSGDLAGSTYGSPVIAPGKVTTAKIADGAITAAKLASPENWHEVGALGEPAFQGSWVNATSGLQFPPTTTAFYKDALGVVHLKGNPTAGGQGRGDPIFFLPVADRPTKTIVLTTDRDFGFALIVIDPDGRVSDHFGAASGALSFDGLSFRTDEG
jgi:hypothetical protein